MYKNQQPTPNRPIPAPGLYDVGTVLRITMDSFTSATERHIEVGDGLEMFIVRTPPPASSSAEGEASSTSQAATAAASAGTSAGTSALDLRTLFGAVEATGGEEEQTPGATMVVRRELKKD